MKRGLACLSLSVACLGLAASGGTGQSVWVPQISGTAERFRGLCAVSATIAWAGGSHGVYARTTDGGVHWETAILPGATDLDFRDVKAFDANTAYLLSSGEGAKSRIYKTADAGRHWTLQYTSTHPGAFFDALGFWDPNHGIALSDPVDGRFLVLTTEDGGTTWKPVPTEGMPPALPGEGAFAASGTCLVVRGSRHVWFGTGGAAARVFRSTDRGRTWAVAVTPLLHGSELAGISSLAFRDARHGVAVGGDYRKPDDSTGNIARTRDGGRSWASIAGPPPHGYRSCVVAVPHTRPGLLIAVGLSGSDRSRDGGQTWELLGERGYHSVSFAGPNAGWAVGEQGRIARFSKHGPTQRSPRPETRR